MEIFTATRGTIRAAATRLPPAGASISLRLEAFRGAVEAPMVAAHRPRAELLLLPAALAVAAAADANLLMAVLSRLQSPESLWTREKRHVLY